MQELMVDSKAAYTLDLMSTLNPSIIGIQVAERQIFVFARKAISRISISNGVTEATTVELRLQETQTSYDVFINNLIDKHNMPRSLPLLNL